MSAVKSIYAGIRALGIAEEEDRRDFFERVTGKRRLREMSPGEKIKVADELAKLACHKHSPPRRQLDGPYAKKLQALWIAAWNLGLVRDRKDAALIAFVKRQTKIDHPNWVRDPASADKAVEALKDWLRRERKVMWGNSNGYDFLRDHGAKIAWAQWCHLYPVSTLTDLTAFRARVFAMVGSKATLERLTSADWRVVSNELGKAVRGGE